MTTENRVRIGTSSLLLMSEGESLLDDSGVVFTKEIVSNGEKRGGLKVIGKKCEITGLEAANLSKVMPSIRCSKVCF